MKDFSDHPTPPANAWNSCQTRRSLLGRLKDWDDERSWQEFYDTYGRLIYNVAMKAGLSDAEAQDVMQETILAVAKKMKDFQYDPALGSFKGFLLQLTGWKIKRQLARRGSSQASAGAADTNASDVTDSVIDPDGLRDLNALWDHEWKQNLIDAACARVRSRVNPAHFQAFHLAAVEHKPASEVARFLGISVGQVYLAKHRVARLMKKELERLEKTWE